MEQAFRRLFLITKASTKSDDLIMEWALKELEGYENFEDNFLPRIRKPLEYFLNSELFLYNNTEIANEMSILLNSDVCNKLRNLHVMEDIATLEKCVSEKQDVYYYFENHSVNVHGAKCSQIEVKIPHQSLLHVFNKIKAELIHILYAYDEEFVRLNRYDVM